MTYPMAPVHGVSETLCFLSQSPGTVEFTPRGPDSDEITVDLFVSLMPSLEATILPRFAETHYYDAILSGALWRLMSSGGTKPYANPQMAATHRAVFRREISRARNQSDRGNVRMTETMRIGGSWA
jgi:hypothetical protein